MIAFVRPPRTPWIGEDVIVRACRWTRLYWLAGSGARITSGCAQPGAAARNADDLVDVNKVRVRDVVVGCKVLIGCTIAVCDPTERIAVRDAICSIATCAYRLCVSLSHIQAKGGPHKGKCKYCRHADLHYKAAKVVLLEIFPDLLV